MIEGGFISAGKGAEPMDSEPGPGTGTSVETMLGAAAGVIGGAGAGFGWEGGC